jgi:RNA polymerase sigma-70 factor (ECF subfamily)
MNATAIPAAAGMADDYGLLARAAQGQPEAFDALLRPRLDRLFRMAVAITRSESDARDAVQNACILAWRELPRLRDHDRFDAWLAQILVNACRGLLRGRRRVQVRELNVDAVASSDVLGGHHATATPTESVAEVELIQRAFSRLDVDSRTLLVLHYMEERPLAEIGQLTGSPVGTVKWRLSNARKALDRALEAERR